MSAQVVVDYEVLVKRYTHEGQTKQPNYRLACVKSAYPGEPDRKFEAMAAAKEWLGHPWTLAAKVQERRYGPGVHEVETVAEYRR